MVTIALGDTHCPFHDKRALDVAYRIISDLQPDKIVLMGDMVDMYAISSFSREPIRVLKLQDELDKTRGVLEQIDSLSDANIIYLEGNHERRLQRYLRLHPEICNLDNLKLEHLLGLDGWSIKQDHTEGNLIYTHGKYISKHSAYSVRRELEARAYQSSIIVGHTHRQGACFVTGSKYTVAGWETGCLCKSMEYCSNANWQSGFVVVTDGYVELVQIRKGKTVFRSKAY